MKRVAALLGVALALTACEPRPANNNAQPQPSSAAPTPDASTPPQPQPSKVVKPTPSKTRSDCKQGKFQLEVEQFLKLEADGVMSEADCVAIKKFQSRFGLRPVDGSPGPATHGVAKRLAASTPSRCNAGNELTACIDLTNQTTWLMKGGKVIYGPTVTRTGFNHPDGKGAPTPTGTYRIKERLHKNWTESFKVYLYYWQRIMDNNGFHETTTYIHDMSLGSHGCVNLLRADAIAYWETLAMGSTVKVFGHRPGT